MKFIMIITMLMPQPVYYGIPFFTVEECFDEMTYTAATWATDPAPVPSKIACYEGAWDGSTPPGIGFFTSAAAP